MKTLNVGFTEHQCCGCIEGTLEHPQCKNRIINMGAMAKAV